MRVAIQDFFYSVLKKVGRFRLERLADHKRTSPENCAKVHRNNVGLTNERTFARSWCGLGTSVSVLDGSVMRAEDPLFSVVCRYRPAGRMQRV